MDDPLDDVPDVTKLAQVVQQLDPAATLRRTGLLRGGISAQMIALERVRVRISLL